MSGIIGFYQNRQDYFDAYKKALVYWNQDYGENTFAKGIENQVFLGVNLDHMSKNTPEQKKFLNRDHIWAVVDALLYNRTELITQYNIDENLSDEELLFFLICENGMEILAQINGDFAGVWYDEKEKRFTLFRDHMGIRPLYYYIDDRTFVFSTDMRGLLALPGIQYSVDEKHLYRELMGVGGICGLETDYKEIGYLQKASYCYVDAREAGIKMSEYHQYWELGKKKVRLKNDAAYIAKMRELVEEAVKSRMDAIDGPIGSEFSGGLDSSVLSALITRLGHEGRYFSWSDDPEVWPLREGKDERKIILDICERDGISCKFRTKGNAIESFTTKEVLERLYPPFVNTLPISVGCQWFKEEGVKAVLTGHGGDQGVSHRCNQYEMWYHHEYYAYLRAAYRKTGGKRHRVIETLKELKYRFTKIHPMMKETGWGPDNIREWMTESYQKRMDKEFEPVSSTFAFDVIEYFRKAGTRERMDNTAFQAAPFGIRYLYPYLDYKVIDFAVSIPRRLYNDGRGNRWIYMKAFADLIPDSLRKMHDKATHSRDSDEKLTKEMIEEANRYTRELIDALDREFWSPYLNFDILDYYYLAEDATEEEYMKHCYRDAYLFYCNMIQYTLDHAGDPVFL